MQFTAFRERMKRRTVVGALLCSGLSSGCLGNRRKDGPVTRGTSETEPSSPTETPIIHDILLENGLDETVSGSITIRKRPTASTPEAAEDRVEKPFELAPEERDRWQDIDLMVDPASIEVSTTGGLTETYQWEGGVRWNAGLWITLRPDSIEFTSRVA